MKAKLIKLEDGEYDLLVESNLEELKNTKLSLKNCEAIERGYDLDELLDNVTPKNGTTGNLSQRIGFVKGFQKALEILGDKKFSEEEMLKAFNKGAFYGSTKLGNTHYFDELIQSLQQTEWDVEVTMKYFTEYDTNPVTIEHKTEPKLDADGCLILRRI